jgi:hypothetical protein
MLKTITNRDVVLADQRSIINAPASPIPRTSLRA